MAEIQFPTIGAVDGDVTPGAFGVEYVWDGVKWSQIGSGQGGGANVSSGDNPPGDANPGDLWFDTSNGIMYVYYFDGTSAQWVDVRPGSGSGGIGDEAPLDGKQYGRQNATWTETDNIPILPELPIPSPTE